MTIRTKLSSSVKIGSSESAASVTAEWKTQSEEIQCSTSIEDALFSGVFTKSASVYGSSGESYNSLSILGDIAVTLSFLLMNKFLALGSLAW